MVNLLAAMSEWLLFLMCGIASHRDGGDEVLDVCPQICDTNFGVCKLFI